MRWILLAIIGTISFNHASAQFGEEFSFLCGARNIAWGQAAVAASDGAAAMHVNSAALGSSTGYSLAGGMGQTLPVIYDLTAHDLAVAGAVLPGRLGVGATWSNFYMDSHDWKLSNSLLRLHAGYRVSEWLLVGLEAARYGLISDGITLRDENNNIRVIAGKESAEAYDLGVSMRSTLNDVATQGDAITIGLQIVNVFDTRATLSELVWFGLKNEKARHLRLGASWSLPVKAEGNMHLKPRLLFGAGTTVASMLDESLNVYPGFTVGASLFDMVTLLFNYETELEGGNETFPWHPVQRFGLLTDLPVGEWLGLDPTLVASVDYTFWGQYGDTEYLKDIRGDDDWSRSAWSIAIHYVP